MKNKVLKTIGYVVQGQWVLCMQHEEIQCRTDRTPGMVCRQGSYPGRFVLLWSSFKAKLGGHGRVK